MFYESDYTPISYFVNRFCINYFFLLTLLSNTEKALRNDIPQGIYIEKMSVHPDRFIKKNGRGLEKLHDRFLLKFADSLVCYG